MDFFNSLTLDLKMLVIGIAGCVVLALFSGNRKSEKRYLVLLAVLAAVGVYRFARVPPEDPAPRSATTRAVPPTVTAPPKHKPLESTSAK
jgi:apolipoprotein N-acyltransferase